MTFNNIPHEMRFYNQWIVWRYEESEGKKPTKNLYSPNWGTQASVTAPGTWGSYDDAVRAYNAGGWSGIGFVFTENDPYSGIDLDDTDGDAEAHARQVRIFQDFPGYAEYSPSGTGLHIIVKGKVERGRRRSKIEIYSKERFFTMTGNVYRDGPIVDCNEQLQILYTAMGGAATVHEVGIDEPEREDDNSVLTRMFEAVNGDKARDLYEGRWDTYYASQSEADFALIDIIAFYTQNRFQITRMFQSSGLGQRDKAKRIDYVYRMINRAFDRQLPPIDTDAFKIAIDEMIARRAAETKTGAPEGPSAPATIADRPGGQSGVGEDGMPYDPARVNPPGLVGEIADFIFAAAPRPVYEIALAGALGLVAGVSARAFNVSGTGLNQYIMLLAPTGTGKEAINRGISKLIQAITPSTPHAPKFIGPGEIRSDAALIKTLAREPCFLSIAGEFGLRLKQMSAPNANSHEIGLRKVMLDLYSKSGFGEQLNPMVYSDRDKNTEVIRSPAFTMIGESTPERFYEALDESMIYEGLLPRFTFIEYNGLRPPLNEGHAHAEPSFNLIDRFGSLVAHASQLMAGQKGVHVAMQPDAAALFKAFDKYCDSMCNANGSKEVTRQFWTRAHVKAMKLAATVAVGCNWDTPVIDRQTAQWATDLIVADVTRLIGKFERGEVGEVNPYGADETKQLDDLISVFASIVRGDAENASKYGLIPEVHSAGIVTYSALSRACLQRAAFRKDRMGSTNALKRSIQHLLDADEIREIPKAQMTKDYGIGARSFIISRPGRFFR